MEIENQEALQIFEGCEDAYECAIAFYILHNMDGEGVCSLTVAQIAQGVHATWVTVQRRVADMISRGMLGRPSGKARGFIFAGERVPVGLREAVEKEINFYDWQERIIYFVAAIICDDASGADIESSPTLRREASRFLDLIRDRDYKPSGFFSDMFRWDANWILDYLARNGYMIKTARGWKQTERMRDVIRANDNRLTTLSREQNNRVSNTEQQVEREQRLSRRFNQLRIIPVHNEFSTM